MLSAIEVSRRTILGAAAVAFAVCAVGPAAAQTELKWAHVYESSEAYHTWAVWAAEEFEKRTDGRYTIEVFPASSLGKETDINEGLGLGTVDIIYTGQLFAGRATARSPSAARPTCSATTIIGRRFATAICSRNWRTAISKRAATTSFR